MYVKLFTSIYQGTLRGNSHGLLVFTNLLAHCDKDGVVDIHPRAVAEEVGLTVEQVRAVLDDLEAPDEESRSPEEGGRRIVRLDDHRAWGWRVVNYAKYRAIKNEDDRREANRLAVAKHRAKKASSSPVIAGNAKSSLSAQAEAEADTEAKAIQHPPAPAAPPPQALESVKPKRKPAAPPLERPEEVGQQTWDDWLALRRAKRAPVTQTVLNGAALEASKAGLSLEEFLRVWCRRGSQGLEAAWLKPEERGHGRPPDDRKSRQLQTAALMTGATRATETEFIDVTSRIIT